MFESFKLQNFRCFQELSLTGLGRVNLIAGHNNVGKTALLEALFIYCGAYNPELTIRVNAFRGVEKLELKPFKSAETPWDSLFYNFSTSEELRMDAKDDKGGNRALRLSIMNRPKELGNVIKPVETVSDKAANLPISQKVLQLKYSEKGTKFYMFLDAGGLRTHPAPEPPPFPSYFLNARRSLSLNEQAELFGVMDLRGQSQLILESLKILEPRLQELSMIFSQGSPMVHGNIGLERPLPLILMGDGMSRLFSLLTVIGNSKDGVILVDEIENGLHHSRLTDIWKAIGKAAADFNTQVFASTHSLECIVAAHRAFSENKNYPFRLHRLENRGGKIAAVTYDQETLEAAIENEFEVR